MKLNVDCVRDTLLFIEREHKFSTDKGSDSLPTNKIFKDVVLMNAYSSDDIAYSINQLHQNGMINFQQVKAIGISFQGWIHDITPTGHEFLENIRNDTNWNQIKNLAKKTGIESIPVVRDIGIKFALQQVAALFV